MWEEGHPRNEAVGALQKGELKEWEASTGYHQRSLAETAMYRYKQLINDKLSLREYWVPADRAAIKALNKINSLGMPVREVVYY
ncbi:probable transposase [Desulfotalea psychrophila LSv54]|uniref:Probable transposase n=1 Tax=Desulfotalea psychrophila (strain LSv54 / DSM 12343) TaxID=177439 RepID=Q6ASA0_DESPS|nr:probable transposase [Desulfotalea psychrophila LSv54]